MDALQAEMPDFDPSTTRGFGPGLRSPALNQTSRRKERATAEVVVAIALLQALHLIGVLAGKL